MPANSTGDSIAAPPATEPIKRFLLRVLPGTSEAVVKLREQLLAFSLDPLASSLLITGPSGAGKSTVARAVAASRRVALLTEEEAEEILRNLKFDGPNQVSELSMNNWYVEQSLTGLLEHLADTQLFGIKKGAATGTDESAGIFEKASNGRMAGKPTDAAKITGGVVFLDEVGDLPANLQGKLLSILSGGAVYRVGGEGDEKWAVRFRGVTITATWKDLTSIDFRPDLLYRISEYRVAVPGLADRAEDLPDIIRSIERHARQEIDSRLDRLAIEPLGMDKDYWLTWRNNMKGLTGEQVSELSLIEWHVRGELRGLTAAVRQVLLTGCDVSRVVERLSSPAASTPRTADPAEALWHRLLSREGNGDGLQRHLREISREDALQLRSILADRNRQSRLARILNIPEQKLRRQIAELGRPPRRSEDDDRD